MNILYISSLSTNISAGPNWSVSASIKAQQNYDNVFWLNLSNVEMPHWKKVKAFHNVAEFEEFNLDLLPSPFDNPDVVVFEGFYNKNVTNVAKIIAKKRVPYIIVPRCSLTRQAQRGGTFKKRLKKLVANLMIFKPYTRKAIAIQYLTADEQRDSGLSWNKCSFVSPNGFTTPENYKQTFLTDGLKAVFIGRLDMYQKGIDELLDACVAERGFLIEHRFKLDIYGPARYDCEKIRTFISEKNLSDVVTLNNEVGGAAKEKVLLDADLFLLPSRFEGHPMGLIEAIAYGVPALVTPGSNMAGEIHAANAGWVCETSKDSIATALHKVVDEKHLLSEKSKAARTLSLNYDWDNIAADFHKQVSNILASAKA
jgi:glycosyltransferase involved in cell wall biosynthesis